MEEGFLSFVVVDPNFDRITDKNYMVFCARYYSQDKFFTDQEFKEDLSRIKYIKKLVTRFNDTGELKERLILNHIIILNNCFGPTILNKVLCLKCMEYMPVIKPFLVFLHIDQDVVYRVGKEEYLRTDTILMDERVIEALRAI